MLIMNEKKFIEDIINRTSEIPNKFSFKRLVDMISKYYLSEYEEYDELLKKVKTTIESLNISYYVDFKYDKVIKTICSNVFNNSLKLKIIDYIPLYKNELDIINTLKKDRDKKLLFTCYIIARFYNTEGWVNVTRAELFQLANISISSKDKNIKIGELIKDGYLSDALKNDNLNIKVKFIEDSEIALKIVNLDNIGNQFISITKKDYVMCEKCSRLIKIKSKTFQNKYCNQCAKEIKNEQNKEYYKNKK